MAMKKTSGGDPPLWQGVGKSFWTLPISGRRRWRIAMCFWKSDRVFRFFPSGGLYRRRGIVRSGPSGHTHRGHGPAPGRAALLCGTLVAPLRLLFGSLEASKNFWMSAFVSSNSENISCVTFLKHKNSRKQETGTMASR
jgi:hypothetical protein